MRTCTIHGCTAPLLDLNIGPFLQDSRVSYVEHTLEILIKSRHGNDAVVRKLGRYVVSQFHAVRSICIDLHRKRVVIPFVRKAFRSVIDALRKGVCSGFQAIQQTLAESLTTISSPKSPKTLGRGSPSQAAAPKQKPGNQKK